MKKTDQRYFDYLEHLKDMGKINLFTAPKMLMSKFSLSFEEATLAFRNWLAIKKHEKRRSQV